MMRSTLATRLRNSVASFSSRKFSQDNHTNTNNLTNKAGVVISEEAFALCGFVVVVGGLAYTAIQIKNPKDNNDDLQNQIKTLASKIDASKDESNNLRNEIKALASKVEASQHENNNLKNEVKTLKASIDPTLQELNKAIGLSRSQTQVLEQLMLQHSEPAQQSNKGDNNAV